MDYLSSILKHFHLDLRPTNAECIDIQSARSILYPGAHIATSSVNEHYHHGIVVDVEAPELSIIHFWGQEKDQSRVQICTLPVFIAGDVKSVGQRHRSLYLVHYEGDSLEKQQQTVQTARDIMASADAIVYNLATKNCESFACFCRTGEWKSEQISILRDLLEGQALQIYDRVKSANQKNRKNIATLLEQIPPSALSATERALYDQLCASSSLDTL